MNDSWDTDSEQEYLLWINSPTCTKPEKIACAELWSILCEDILKNGPIGLTQPKQVTKDDGVNVDLYCLIRYPNIAMYFAYRSQYLHLVFLGPYSNPGSDDIALQRTKRW